MLRALTGRIVYSYMGRRLTEASFPGQRGEAAGSTTRAVVGVFARGARASLTGESPDTALALAANEAEIPWYRRSYFWEGYAMGLAARHALSLARGSPDGRRITDLYRGMHYTGYGFWNGLALNYPLPRISLKPRRWAAVDAVDALGDFAQLAPLMAGGMGFALTQSIESLDRALPRLRRLLERDPSWGLATLHGCGRALWFLYMDNPQEIEVSLAGHSHLRDGLTEGLGLAVAYTRMDTPEAMGDELERLPCPRHVLLRGAGACLQALIADDPHNEARLDAIRDPGLLRAWEVCRWAATKADPGPGWYADVTLRMRAELT